MFTGNYQYEVRLDRDGGKRIGAYRVVGQQNDLIESVDYIQPCLCRDLGFIWDLFLNAPDKTS